MEYLSAVAGNFAARFSLKFMSIFTHISGSIEPTTQIWESMERSLPPAELEYRQACELQLVIRQLSSKFEVFTGESLAWSNTLTGHFSYNENCSNWKFVAEYGTPYFIILPHNTMQKSFVIRFLFTPLLRNNFITHNASS